MAELIRLRVPGLRLQRSVERQFGEMADAVFDRLAPFLDREFAGLTESGREAVVNGVRDTRRRRPVRRGDPGGGREPGGG